VKCQKLRIHSTQCANTALALLKHSTVGLARLMFYLLDDIPEKMNIENCCLIICIPVFCECRYKERKLNVLGDTLYNCDMSPGDVHVFKNILSAYVVRLIDVCCFLHWNG